MACPTPANMKDCDPKCRCSNGACGAFSCSAPCPPGTTFDAATCDCIDPVPDYEQARWTGTLTDGLNNTISSYTSSWYDVSNEGDYMMIGGAWQSTIASAFELDADHCDFPTFPNTCWSMPNPGVNKWRATVVAVDNSTASGGYSKYLGGLGINENPNPTTLFAEPPILGMPSTNATGVIYRIDGVWEFKNFADSTPQATWAGL